MFKMFVKLFYETISTSKNITNNYFPIIKNFGTFLKQTNTTLISKGSFLRRNYSTKQTVRSPYEICGIT